MPTVKKKSDFLNSVECAEIKEQLIQLGLNNAHNTVASYSSDGATYPDNLMPFVDKHIKYLSEHQNISPEHYLSNLRLITRRK